MAMAAAKDFPPGAAQGVQHLHPGFRSRGQHRQPGGRVLNVKKALPERLQPLQAAGIRQLQTVGQPGWGATPTPSSRSRSAAAAVDALPVFTWAWGSEAGRCRQPSAPVPPPCPAVGQIVCQPLGMTILYGGIRGRGQGFFLTDEAAQYAVDQSGRARVFRVLTGQIHRFVHRCAVGDPVQKQDLIGPQPQTLQYPLFQLPQRKGGTGPKGKNPAGSGFAVRRSTAG